MRYGTSTARAARLTPRPGGSSPKSVGLASELMRKAAATPAFVYDEARILAAVRDLARLGDLVGCRPLFAMKSFTIVEALSLMAPHLDGFAASSLFEARLAREVLGTVTSGTVHITTPGFAPDEFDAVAHTCDYIAFNSLGQWERFRAATLGRARPGLRVNPGLSFVADDRYDPCRRHSKLGTPIDRLEEACATGTGLLAGLTGILVHTNCDSESFAPLLATVEHVVARLGGLLDRLSWVNLGGGYLYRTADDMENLRRAVELLRRKRNLEVFIEPGAGVVRDAGFLVSSVLDLFDSGGKTVAVLDTSVNHMPETFEYQSRPDVVGDVIGHEPDGVAGNEPGDEPDVPHRYILAGCTCLAGDLFGEYAFREPLDVGSRVVFANAGAYTLVKAHTFNGVNLPAVYALTEAGELVLRRRFTYEDFASRCGAPAHAAV